MALAATSSVTLARQVDVFRVGEKYVIATAVPIDLLRGGENPDNKIQIRGVLDQHVRELVQSITKQGMHLGTNLLVRRCRVLVDRDKYDLHVKSYGAHHVVTETADGHYVYYYDVFDGNHRLRAVRQPDVLRGAEPLLGCVIHSEDLPTVLAEKLAAHVNDVQAIARKNSYADIMVWTKNLFQDQFGVTLLLAKEHQEGKRARMTGSDMTKASNANTVKFVVEALCDLVNNETGAEMTVRFKTTQTARVKVGGWLDWQMIAALALVQNTDWMAFRTCEAACNEYAVATTFTNAALKDVNHVFPSSPQVTAELNICLQSAIAHCEKEHWSVASDASKLQASQFLMAFHLAFGAWRMFGATAGIKGSSERVVACINTYLSTDEGRQDIALLWRDLDFVRRMQESHSSDPIVKEKTLPASLREKISDGTQLHLIFAEPQWALLAFIFASGLLHVAANYDEDTKPPPNFPLARTFAASTIDQWQQLGGCAAVMAQTGVTIEGFTSTVAMHREQYIQATEEEEARIAAAALKEAQEISDRETAAAVARDELAQFQARQMEEVAAAAATQLESEQGKLRDRLVNSNAYDKYRRDSLLRSDRVLDAIDTLDHDRAYESKHLNRMGFHVYEKPMAKVCKPKNALLPECEMVFLDVRYFGEGLTLKGNMTKLHASGDIQSVHHRNKHAAVAVLCSADQLGQLVVSLQTEYELLIDTHFSIGSTYESIFEFFTDDAKAPFHGTEDDPADMVQWYIVTMSSQWC